MKKIITISSIIAVVLVIIAGFYFYDSVSASIAKIYYDLRLIDSLVGYWSFNGSDVSGVVATDRSGGGNTGTLTGGPPTTAVGVVGQALQFNGTSDYVSVTDSASFSWTSSGLTAEAWIKGAIPSSNKSIVSKSALGSDTALEFNISVETDGRIRLWISTDGSGTGLNAYSNVAITANQWNHIVGTYDGSNLYVYLNGTAGTAQARTGTVHNGAGPLHVGGWPGAGASTWYWNGFIDEARVYNKALSAAEVAYRYSRTAPENRSKPKTPNNNGLVAFWNFDDCDTCSTAKDFSGNGNIGTFVPSSNYHTANGKINRGISLNGTTQYVSVTDQASLDLTSAISISAWINMSSIATGNTAVSKHKVSPGSGYSLSYYPVDNKFYWQGGDGTTWATLNVASVRTYTQTNQWIHLVGTFDGTTGYLYVDNELVGSDTSAALGANNNNIWIGGNVDSAAANFSGLIDEVRIYNRALSAAEVKTLYGQGSAKFTIKAANNTGLVGFWNFDDCDTCSTAKDFSNTGNTGTFQGNAAHTAAGKVNGGATFDGTGDYVLVNDSASLDLTSAITVSAWVNLSSLTCTGVDNAGLIISKHTSVTNNDGYLLSYSCSTKKINFQGADGTAWNLIINSSQTYSETSRWHHIVGTFDGTTGYLYVDGELAGSDTSAALSANNQNFWIGGDVNTNNNFFNGKIDEVRIYNRVLSAVEVANLYFSGR